MDSIIRHEASVGENVRGQSLGQMRVQRLIKTNFWQYQLKRVWLQEHRRDNFHYRKVAL